MEACYRQAHTYTRRRQPRIRRSHLRRVAPLVLSVCHTLCRFRSLTHDNVADSYSVHYSYVRRTARPSLGWRWRWRIPRPPTPRRRRTATGIPSCHEARSSDAFAKGGGWVWSLAAFRGCLPACLPIMRAAKEKKQRKYTVHTPCCMYIRARSQPVREPAWCGWALKTSPCLRRAGWLRPKAR